MKTPIQTLIVLALTTLIGVACSKKDNNSSAPANTSGTGGTNTNNVILKMHYFKGGFFAPPNTPNWTYDLTVDFTNYISGYLITAKHVDSLCFRANGRLTDAETTSFLNLVAQLQLYISTGPVMADGGVEYIEFTLQDGSKRRYHLMNGEVPAGEYYASNPQSVVTFLRDLNNSLPVACQ